jgi:DNA-directed RNA polymerase subunit E'/Rpb7
MIQNDDNKYIAIVIANKTYENSVTRDYKTIITIYAKDYKDVEKKLIKYISDKSIKFEVTHKLKRFELSEPLQRKTQEK